jgi:hypothetical protein
MRTTVRIDDELLAEAKALGLRTGRTLTKVIEDALRESVARDRVPGEVEPFELPTFGEGGTMPGVNLDSWAELLDLMERDDPH